MAGLLGPSSNQHANATPNGGHQAPYRVYYVYYRTCPHQAWVIYGGYYNPSRAAVAVNYFRAHGYGAFYR